MRICLSGNLMTLVIPACVLTPGLVASAFEAQPAVPHVTCAKTDVTVEELICTDRSLAALDQKMVDAYRSAMKKWPANIAAGQRSRQRGWIAWRNGCSEAKDVRSCVEASYMRRLAEIGSLVVPTPKPAS